MLSQLPAITIIIQAWIYSNITYDRWASDMVGMISLWFSSSIAFIILNTYPPRYIRITSIIRWTGFFFLPTLLLSLFLLIKIHPVLTVLFLFLFYLLFLIILFIYLLLLFFLPFPYKLPPYTMKISIIKNRCHTQYLAVKINIKLR